jgi:hypothetical protein
MKIFLGKPEFSFFLLHLPKIENSGIKIRSAKMQRKCS